MITTDDLVARVSGLVYEKKQRGLGGLDLTLKTLSRLESSGALDFGDSEYRTGIWLEVACEKASEDKYGWWHLSAGTYRVEYNESFDLKGTERALVTQHPRLLEAGGHHASALFAPDESPRTLLQVSEVGLSLKENCRLSRLNIIS